MGPQLRFLFCRRRVGKRGEMYIYIYIGWTRAYTCTELVRTTFVVLNCFHWLHASVYAPDAPKDPPKDPQEAPKKPPGSPQEAPRGPQKRPKWTSRGVEWGLRTQNPRLSSPGRPPEARTPVFSRFFEPRDPPKAPKTPSPLKPPVLFI